MYSRVSLPRPPQHILVYARERELARGPLLCLVLVLRWVLPRQGPHCKVPATAHLRRRVRRLVRVSGPLGRDFQR